MDKTGALQPGLTPCAGCGSMSSDILEGEALCPACRLKGTNTRGHQTTKAAADHKGTAK